MRLASKRKVALAAIKGDRTLALLAEQSSVSFRLSDPLKGGRGFESPGI
jgi:hypothetical protein